jgi:hypothetical protein
MDMWGPTSVAGPPMDSALTWLRETTPHTTIRRVENTTERSENLFMTLSLSTDMQVY